MSEVSPRFLGPEENKREQGTKVREEVRQKLDWQDLMIRKRGRRHRQRGGRGGGAAACDAKGKMWWRRWRRLTQRKLPGVSVFFLFMHPPLHSPSIGSLPAL